MRVLVVAGPPERFGGSELSTLDVVRGLVGRGHEIDYVHQEEPGSLLADFAAVCSSIQQVEFRAPPDRLSLPARPDVVYTSLPSFLPFGAVVADAMGVRVVCRLNVPAEWGDVATLRSLSDSVYAFLAVSRATHDDYIEAGLLPDKVRVVYPGIDTDLYRDGPDNGVRESLGVAQDTFVVLYAGRLDPTKGVEVLLDGWRLLKGAAGEQLLLVAGGPRNHRSAEAAREYVDGLLRRRPPDSVWLGRRSDIAELYRASDLVVVPSTCNETFGRSVIEALASGRPVVASAVGGIPEILTPPLDRFLVPPGDPEALAARIESLRRWRHDVPEMAGACRTAVVERFRLQRQAEEVEAVLEGAVRNRASSSSATDEVGSQPA